jgi:methionyl-tRNA formyltransferase
MPAKPLKLIFAGTPEFAAIHLKALIESEHQLIGVYTQPDRPAGRGKKLHASPVKQLAEEAGVSVFQPRSLKDEQAQQQLAGLGADVMVVVAYGLILPQAVLDAPRLGCLNVHASLLPRWRGAAPIQRAIEAGDAETGITIMQMDAGLDTGDMLATASCPIKEDTSAASLHNTLAGLGPPLLLDVLDRLPELQQSARTQDDQRATYASKIVKSEAQLDWTLDAASLDRAIRAFNPFPVCFSRLGSERVKVWLASVVGTNSLPEPPGTIIRADKQGIIINCGKGQLAIQQLQLPGGKALSAEQVLNSRRELFAPGQAFSPPDESAN